MTHCWHYYTSLGVTRDLDAMGLLTQVKKGDDVRNQKKQG